MSPQLIAQAVIGLLIPYLAKAGEAAASKLGEQLFVLLKNRFAERPAAQTALADLKAAPDDPDSQAALRLQLRKLLQTEPGLVAELQALLPAADQAAAGSPTFNLSAGDNARQVGQVNGDVNFN
jgi:hypothetical protein